VNNAQRKQISTLCDTLSNIRARVEDEAEREGKTLSEYFGGIGGELSDVQSAVSELAGEEREKFENLSEGLQGADNGQAIEQAADTLEDCDSNFDEAVTACEDVEDNWDADHVAEAVDTVLNAINESVKGIPK
jgi:phage-related protein